MDFGRQPELFVISGPNGAGKSSYTRNLTSPETVIINADELKEKLAMETRMSGGLTFWMKLDKEIDAIKQRAMADRSDVAIETTLVDHANMDKFNEFRKKGYRLNLVYIGLDTLSESAMRVATRVKKGGHNVPASEREINFFMGRESTMEYAQQFDTVTLYSNPLGRKPGDGPKELLVSLDRQIVRQSDNLPQWAAEFREAILHGYDRGMDNGYGK